MKYFRWLAFALLLFSLSPTYAETNVGGVASNRSTKNVSATITTGNTFQVLLTSILGTSTQRQALTIENNNASDNCWLFIGTGTPTTATAILLLPGGSYTRYWPYVPSDQFQGTCASNSDTFYMDVQ